MKSCSSRSTPSQWFASQSSASPGRDIVAEARSANAAVMPPPSGLRSAKAVPLAVAVLAISLLFGPWLYELAVFAGGDDRYSHILLVPFISGYLVWLRRDLLRGGAAANRKVTGMLVGIGVTLLLGYMVSRLAGVAWRREDSLALTTTAFVLTLMGATRWCFGESTARALGAPLGFLFFMVPLPNDLMEAVETVMQHGSAAVAHLLYSISGMPVFYDDLTFQLPGIALRVAPECSGIRSTLVLLIVSVLTGYLFLRSPRRRVWLALAVVPLALARNGFRIFVIGELCVRIGPEMIDSYLHRKGGPIFFALSLVPLFLLLIGLQRGERLLPRHRPDPLPSATH